eukprot:GEMP01006383.1.p1 GENE.GEMP01006383.1~~GEMP01006383.1.p1  ORF type:complete len:821 (+),score=136.29 GEMP01006383.1:222-2684(+)
MHLFTMSLFSHYSLATDTCVPACPDTHVCLNLKCTRSISGLASIDNVLLRNSSHFDATLLLSQRPTDRTWAPSTLYRWRDFTRAIVLMHATFMHAKDLQFWLGNTDEPDNWRRHKTALVNVAAFLSQSMTDSIAHDYCDEVNMDNTNNFAISNACGQFGANYDTSCAFACPPDNDRILTTSANTSAYWMGAPGPLFCAPNTILRAAGKLDSNNRTGHWRYDWQCDVEEDDSNSGQNEDPVWLREPCKIYPHQRAGHYVWDGSGDSVEGCCWWARGALHANPGRCAMGHFNHFVGKPHTDNFPMAVNLYPTIDFCADPGAICRQNTKYPELKWVAGLFAWAQKVQTHDQTNWRYFEEVERFVDTGMADSRTFIDKVSAVVTAGCSHPPCGIESRESRQVQTRRKNFDLALHVLLDVIPTPSPTPSPMPAPIPTPGPNPGRECGQGCPDEQVCLNGWCTSDITGVRTIDDVLLLDANRYNTRVFLSQNPDLSWRPSRIYKWKDFAQAAATMHINGVADMFLYLGDADADDGLRTKLALVNLAAFLAQCMKETIQYDACDENNWDLTNGYKISNSCGQLGQDYADYDCELACPRDNSMQITAVTNAAWYGAPGPMFCAPDSALVSKARTPRTTGRWAYNTDCWPYPATKPGFQVGESHAWQRRDCKVYKGQKGGKWIWDGSGRGVIQTSGRCNFGILNHYLGNNSHKKDVKSMTSSAIYPELDFCKNPEEICSNKSYPELKWVAGLFYWMNSVQNYEADGWKYLDYLKNFVEGGMQDDSFIDAVSGIVNRGCHNPPCKTGAVDGLTPRRQNFQKVLKEMGFYK